MITYTIEKLYHFQCSKCNKWWSVGDYNFNGDLTCPFCEHTSRIINKNNAPNVDGETIK